jgi:hypothetical protein
MVMALEDSNLSFETKKQPIWGKRSDPAFIAAFIPACYAFSASSLSERTILAQKRPTLACFSARNRAQRPTLTGKSAINWALTFTPTAC